MKNKNTISSLEGKYAIIICVITMITALISVGIIISDMIEIFAMPQPPISGDKWAESRKYSSLISAGTFLIVSLFAFSLHRPMLNNDH